MIFAELQESNGETLLVIRAVAPKDPNQETPTEVPNFTIYIDESWITHDYITPAITDVTTRTFKDDQIKLMTACKEAPNHLVVEKFKKIEAAHAATQRHETLILVTAEQDEKDHYLTVLDTKTGQELKVSNAIELIDSLDDLVKPLKQKTLVNINVTIKVDLNTVRLVPLDFVQPFEASLDSMSYRLRDQASKESLEYKFRLTGELHFIEISYTCEDVTIARKVIGGMILNCSH